MNKLKYPLLAAFCYFLLAAGLGLNMWFEPHRDVKAVPVFDEFTVDDFIDEFILDPDQANEKYLAENGDSKVVSMTGSVHAIETNLRGGTVVELRSSKVDAGVRFALMDEEQEKASALKVGENIKITGVISAGPIYDADFGGYLDAIIEQAYF